jgi:hypothetical protein
VCDGVSRPARGAVGGLAPGAVGRLPPDSFAVIGRKTCAGVPTGDTVSAETRRETEVQSLLIAIVSVLVGGGLAGATLVGLVNSQTSAPSHSPGNSNQSILDAEYGK